MNTTRRGFALLIVVTLLAFIVLLLMGLAAYTQIETAVAGNTQRQAQARENALLALNVALGQLQKNAGPDRRATATAEAFPNRSGTTRYVGVWPTNQAEDDDGDALTPLTWLVSGNELRDADGNPQPRAITPTTATNTNNGVALVSSNTSRISNDIMARLVPINAEGVPGIQAGTAATIGRYAWWVGDQGVKAPVAVPDTSTSITVAPYDSSELRGRIRQQMAVGAGAATTAGAVVFEPRDSNNSPLVAGHRVITPSQFAYLRNSSNNQLGLTLAQQYFHLWSPGNWSVLADTKNGGLRRDLSLAPELLGTAFTAWANYTAYMEPPIATEVVASEEAPAVPPPILPAYSSDPIRRRYVMTPHLFDEDSSGSHQVAPVLTYFLLTFNVRTVSGSASTTGLEVRARWMVSLWNPYTSALVPENLRIEIAGLPTSVTLINETEGREGHHGSFSLRDPSIYGSQADGAPLRINLPWTSTVQNYDRQSWLPGRVYTWRSKASSTGENSPPDEGYDSDFYSRTLSGGGSGVIRPLSLPNIDGDDMCHLDVSGSERLEITLFAMRPEGPVRLARLTSPDFTESFSTNPQEAYRGDYQFSYVFRLAEPVDTPLTPHAWLTTTGRDVRRRTLPAEMFVVAENGNNPADYGASYSKISRPDRLLDRAEGSLTYNEDVPVFELPRGPLLSLGALQHFRQPGQRPFMIGNPWGASFQLNSIRTAELFDRFFFSGLVSGLTPATAGNGDLILPNPLLKPLRKPTADDLRSAPEARSSKHLLQGGAFNLNSVNAAAWAAVLRGVRFPSPQTFRYLNASSSNGTAADSAATVQSSDAQFFRFSQSAQETYKAEAGMSAPNEETETPPNTHLYRKGMRTLTAAQVSVLAAKIVELIRAKHAVDGPYRSLDEFLSPSEQFAGVDAEGNASGARSLLEAAIADAETTGGEKINSTIAEFSSQWLTQADIMTALAPILFPRSDTFIIRTYGEVINPATNATEGRAWGEAIVQRVPEYLDATADAPEILPDALASEVNRTSGRRFKVISFRWLTRSDI